MTESVISSDQKKKRPIIVHNRICCNHCGDIIESTYRHDLKNCKCGLISIDGRHDYLRRGFTYGREDYTDLSEIADTQGKT